MRFITITIFAVTRGMITLAIAKPIPNWKTGGMAVPLARHSPFMNSNKSIDLDAISSYALSLREKILSGLDNYEMNTGTMHPFAVTVKGRESGLGTRGASVSLTTYQNLVWSGDISIGTPAKNLKVQIDTGSADMWVLQSGCDGISRDQDHELWDPEASKSAKDQGQSFQFEYADGSTVKGGRFTDNVTIAGFTADAQTFGSATSYTSQLQNNGYSDGLLGLAFPSVSKFTAYPLFESLTRQNQLINSVFSLKLSSSGAEMYIGGTNSMLYNGEIAYTPVTVPGFWQVSVDDVRVNGNTIGIENIPAVLDTGSNYIFGDWAQVSELYRRIGNARVKVRRSYSFYYLPCDSFPTLSLTFGGKTFEIPPEVLRLKPLKEGSPNCFSALVGERSPSAIWIIGIPFLQSVYSVFDYTALRVGFANLA